MAEETTTRSAKSLTPEEALEFIARLWTPDETAEYLGLASAKVLATWRCTNRYNLPFANIGGKIMYDPVKVRAWVASRTTVDGVTPRGVRKRRSGGVGKPKGGWPSERRKRRSAL